MPSRRRLREPPTTQRPQKIIQVRDRPKETNAWFKPLFLAFGLGIGILYAFITNQRKSNGDESSSNWWKKVVIYQIYPRSFQDSNGDGVGDIKGIESRLDYLSYLGVGAIWLSPVYKSPMADFGYDISDFKDIDPIFGTIDDFESLIKAGHDKGLKVVMDYVPNHTSDEHPWFQESRASKTNKYRDYYTWHPGRRLSNGTRRPPNNWLSVFGGSAWEWDPKTQEYYLHQFVKGQPDLNWRNTEVQQEMLDVLQFWLDRDVDGFRIDAIKHMYESRDVTKDEPLSKNPNTTPDQYEYLDHIYTTNDPEIHDQTKKWRLLFEKHLDRTGKYIYMVAEMYDTNITETMKYYNTGCDQPFNFNLIMPKGISQSCDGVCVKELIDEWFSNIPSDGWPSWVVGNHDQKRVTTRVGLKRAVSVNMLLLLLPGTPTTYYGEELSMEDIHMPYHLTQDPYGKRFGPDRYTEFSRDPSRSPMQWESSPNAGFSKAKKTWLPVHPKFRAKNVKVQKDDPSGLSPLQIYRQLVQLKTKDSVQNGKFKYAVVNKEIYSFVRHIDGQPSYLVAINVGTKLSLTDFYAGTGNWLPEDGVVTLTSGALNSDYLTKGNVVDLQEISLDPGEGVVIEFWRKLDQT